LTGKPGTGKTTLIRKAIEASHIPAGGFFTREIIEDNHRAGFEICSLYGGDAILAHVNVKSHVHLGKYNVDMSTLNRIGVKAIVQAIESSPLIIIDEIGKMELVSDQFKNAVLAALDSPKPVLGTITLWHSSFTQAIRRSPEVEMLHVTQTNRDSILTEVITWLSSLKL